MCFSAGAAESADRFDQLNLTQHDVEKIRADLKAIQGVDPNAVDELINLVALTQNAESDTQRAEAYVISFFAISCLFCFFFLDNFQNTIF